MNTRISRSGQAFDAAGASGLAFLTSALAQIDPVITRPLSAQTYERDIDIRYGGGLGAEFINSWATNYATTGGGQYGLQGTNNTDIPNVQIDIQMGTWRAFIWTQAFTITYADLRRMEFANQQGVAPPVSFQQMYEEAVDSIWQKAMDRVTYLGWLGQPGLINSSAISAITLANALASATPLQILNELNGMIETVIANSVYDLGEGMPNRWMIPWSVFGYLSQPMTTAGSESAIAYIERSNVAATSGTPLKILPLPDPWIGTAGAGGTKRTVLYRKDPKALDLFVPQIPTNIMTNPTTRNGVGYETVYMGNIGQLRLKRAQTALYGDGA